MSTPQIPPTPDAGSHFEQVFEAFWTRTVPFPFSSQPALKTRAKAAFGELVGELFAAAGNPRTVKAIIAINKIGRMLQAARVISADPNPDPEVIANALEQFFEKYKPQPMQEQP